MTGTEVVVALVIAVGLVGIVLPVLPGSILVVGAVLAWAIETGGVTAWVVFAVATTLVASGTVVRYAVPGKRLKSAGIPNSTLLLAAVLGVIGFFVVPVVGLVLGFVLGIYLAEWLRLRDARQAWPSTVHALKAVGLGIVIELVAALLATVTWVVGVIAT